MSNTAPFVQQSLWTWVIRFFLVYTIACFCTKYSQVRRSHLRAIAAFSCVTPAALSWLLTVTRYVPEPYLDEVFHIPQAQVYCRGRYLEWDDKITTPPGLYIVTILFNRLLRLPCSVYNLRAFNVDVVSCISVVALICRAHLMQTPSKPDNELRISAPDILTGINIALFPVLFFFSGLYYTDPSSTLVVLLAYANHRTRIGTDPPAFLNNVYSFLLGVVALGFRQTNIFWVVIYMGGLEVVHAIKALDPEPVETPKSRVVSEQIKFYTWRYCLGDIHDPPLSLAQPIDIMVCVLSIGISAVYNLPMIVRRFLWPHCTALIVFVAFVAWNGGVVLGDKSNHVATLHLTQMLYIWPLFAFFSAPLFIPQLLNLASTVCQSLASKTESKRKARTLSTFLIHRQSPTTSSFNRFSMNHLASGVLVCCGAMAVSLFVVRFNTIIHPFTLADNRHYMFYAFRYSILKAWWVRYALVPVYVACAWMCWCALRASKGLPSAQGEGIQSPFIPASQTTPSSAHQEAPAQSRNPTEAEAGSAPPPTSTVLLLLLATTLSLMTAPLVEPRYFILPWIFWRLLVPTPTLSPSSFLPKKSPAPSETIVALCPHPTSRKYNIPTLDHVDGEDDNKMPTSANATPDLASSGTVAQSKRSGQGRSGGLIVSIVLLEMFWFILINTVTMYVFVTRPFYWRAPGGMLLDKGRVQRFMW